RNMRATRLKRRDRVTRVLTPPLPGLTFRAAVRDVLDDYRMNRKRSLRDVERHVRLHLGPFFGRRRLTAITTADVRRYVLRRQKEGARNATINRELAVLSRAFSLAIAAGTVPSRPHVALLREDNARRGFFEAEEFAAVRRRLPPDLADCVSCRRGARPRPARFPPDRGPKSRPRRRPRAGRDAVDRLEVPSDARPLPHRQRRRSHRRREEARRGRTERHAAPRVPGVVAGPPAIAYNTEVCIIRPMESTISATELARNLGDILGKVRYRREVFS